MAKADEAAVTPSRPVIELRDPRSWHRAVERIVHRHIPPTVITALRKVPAAKMYDDTMKYLDQALGDVGAEPVAQLLPGLQRAVSREFSAVRAFHGCKPVSMESYYRNGITPLTRQWLVQEAFDLFDGMIPLAELQRLAARADLSIRQGLVWFATDPDELTGLAGHYLVYGPESMNCLWKDDDARFRESQERQRKRGIPTLFECTVPMAMIGCEWKHELTKTLVTRYFKGRSVTPDPEGESGDWGFSVRRTVGPEHIVGHTHPAVILDPLRHGTDYRNPVVWCPWCR